MDIRCCFYAPPARELSNDIVVLIDVLRATSNIVTMLDKGAKKVFLFEDEDEPKSQKLYYPNAVLAGERDCEKIRGFDMGNSPSESLNFKIKGREVFLTTTNGTKAAIAASVSDHAYVGSILNITAVCELVGKLAKQTAKNITLLCAGWKGNAAIDDIYTAGAIINKSIVTGSIRNFEIDDSARIAKLVHGGFPRPMDALLASISGKMLSERGLTSDIAFCAKPDLYKIVPKIVKEDGFIIAKTDKQEE